MNQKNTIKLFVDAHVLDEVNQGTATFIRGLYSSMPAVSSNLEVYLGVFDKDFALKEPELASKCKIIRYRWKNKFLRLLVDIPLIISKYKIDYAHFQYFTPLIKNCKWIVTVHDLLFNDFPDEFPFIYRMSRNVLFRSSLMRSEIKTTVSDYSRKAIERDYGIDSSAIGVLPNAVDPVFFAEYSKPEVCAAVREKFQIENYILFVSRIEPRKNHLMLLRAFFELELDLQGFQLVFVGRRSIDVPELEKYINDLPVARRSFLRRLENVPYNDLISVYRGANLFVYPSKGEGFGIPPLEAVAAGIPTLCSDTTAMKDFYFFDDCFFDPSDSNSLKMKIMKYIHRNNDDMIRANRVKVQSMYNWDVSANELKLLINADVKRCES